MNNLSLVTKIKIDSMPYGDFKYLKIKKGKFLIYNEKEILLFNKNLSYKKLFPFHDEKEISIKFIKKISCGRFLSLNNNNIYIFTIEPEIKIIKKIKLDNYKWIRHAIELKNGIILATNDNSILKIIINDNKEEINEIFRIPDECKVKNIKKIHPQLFFDIYNLPNNDNIILINSHSFGSYHPDEGCVRMTEFYKKNMIFTFNVNECKIIDYIKILENNYLDPSLYGELKIIINNKYIFASNNNDKIYIISLSDYKIIKELDIDNKKIFDFKDNKIFILNIRFYRQLNLYDFSNLTKIKYQNIPLEEIICDNYFYEKLFSHDTIIEKFSDDKILFSKDNEIYIIKF